MTSSEPPRHNRLSGLGGQPWRSAALVLLGATAATGLAALAMPRAATPAATAATAPAAALSVTTAPLRRADWPATLEATGVIEAWQEASIGAQLPGLRLVEVNAAVGDTVRRGQVLARFDDAMPRAELAQLQAALEQAVALAAQSSANRGRALQLQGSGGISEQEVLQYTTLAGTGAAQVALVRAQLAAKRLQLAYTEIRAPDDGVISARDTTLGAVAGSGQQLFRLIRQGRLEWRGELSPAQLGELRRAGTGRSVVLSLPDGGSALARVRQSAPRLDPLTRLGLVYADLDPGGAARAGMYAGGRIVLAQRAALVAPAASVVLRDGRSYVMTIAPALTVQASPVTLGRRQGDEVELLDPPKGLAEGSRIAVSGAGFLNDGDLVRVIDPAAPGSQP